MGMMDSVGDMRAKRERFEELHRMEEDDTIDDAGRQELQQLRTELFGKDM
jgi:hypothetical protein